MHDTLGTRERERERKRESESGREREISPPPHERKNESFQRGRALENVPLLIED
jgi:hypothetical protein